MISSIGDHFVVGLSGTSLTPDERRMLGQLRPAGIILFRHNLSTSDSWALELHELIADTRAACGREQFLVSIDHEGGRVRRLAEPATQFPAACHFGERSEAVGRAIGRELFSLGINLNFAPVLDIRSNPENNVIGDRAFATDGQTVARLAMAFLHGMEAAGVVGCGKHFPGHGDTVADSHFELPRLEVPREMLEQREL
ncbi:MAG: glycoside hydrolase family 3 protein, partial [Bdellovibrionales bacterium]|nr:glycoside hydrolase family 3 protein [Bdellovibrionales bacterium]